ncbi:MAG: TIGR04283 family arsenosugar biosynthesis glycosyltransferase [Syntrophobacterales bacterium]|jgi:rSAM/selenodomain-associated transferase 2
MKREKDSGEIAQEVWPLPFETPNFRHHDFSETGQTVTSPAISIIIPVLNEGKTLGETLANVPCDPDLETIIVDGGSADDTLAVAAGFPLVRRLTAPRGRGCQMNAGALASSGELLVFLHADTLLTADHLQALRRAIADPAFAAGAFELALRPPTPALRFIAWGANRRARIFGLPYGDQVLIIRRSLFLSLRGFVHRRPEDLDLVLRLKGRTRLKILSPLVSSSGRRWLEKGYLRTTLHNWLALARHLAERAFTRSWPKKGDLAESGGGGRGPVASDQ